MYYPKLVYASFTIEGVFLFGIFCLSNKIYGLESLYCIGNFQIIQMEETNKSHWASGLRTSCNVNRYPKEFLWSILLILSKYSAKISRNVTKPLCNLCLLSKWSQAKKYVAKVSYFSRCISCVKSWKLILFWTYAPLSSWQLFAWMKHPCESGISEFAILIFCKKKTLDFLYFLNFFARAWFMY